MYPRFRLLEIRSTGYSKSGTRNVIIALNGKSNMPESADVLWRKSNNFYAEQACPLSNTSCGLPVIYCIGIITTSSAELTRPTGSCCACPRQSPIPLSKLPRLPIGIPTNDGNPYSRSGCFLPEERGPVP